MSKYDLNLTREQRLRIYAKALSKYKRENKRHSKNGCWVDGMCMYLSKAIEIVTRKKCLTNVYVNRRNLPEYFSFKPKTGWKESPCYWWTRRAAHGGYERRVAVLTALAEGKSKEPVKK